VRESTFGLIAVFFIGVALGVVATLTVIATSK
jgi:hypothetical protein